MTASPRPQGPRRRLVPAYLATHGRTAAAGAHGLDRLSVLHAAADLPAGVGGEHRQLWELVRPGALTLAEAAAHLRLPVSATVFIAADLAERGALSVRAPIPSAQPVSRDLAERLLSGLRALK
ncbi:DUF742 domain-containing protein [Kitasatospora sp. NPDC057198]|uniref:DUF742 domain-containing protein n=1 Tax=Kitasatospora sp. NPDC057198 TaxID=3346046 RepID=UPI003644A589